MRKIFIGVLCFFILGIVGCGYTTKSALPPRLKTINIQPFKNSINYATLGDRDVYFQLLEVKVHNAVVDRFQFDGNLRIVQPEAADLILKGEVVESRRNPLRYTSNDDVEEYRIQIVMKLELLDVKTGEPMWEYDRFVGEATYFLTGVQATSEDSAVAEAALDIARRIVETTIENW